MAYTKLNSEIIAKLKAILGPENVLTDEEKMQPYAHDEVPDPNYQRLPEAVGFAHTAQQVAAVVRLANEFHFPVVPRGTGTGLAVGAVATSGGLVLSLEKMNKILYSVFPIFYHILTEIVLRAQKIRLLAKT